MSKETKLLEEIERLKDCIDTLCTTQGKVTLRIEVQYSKDNSLLIITGPREFDNKDFAALIAQHLHEMCGVSEVKAEETRDMP
jgi:hypothetical protein